MALIETPEFWSALAFVFVMLISVYPLSNALKTWGKKKANVVQNQFDEAKNLVSQAEKLKQQYEEAYLRRSAERQKLMREAETEIRFLEKEALQQSSDRMRRTNEEVKMRLKMIAENGRQDIKRKILDHVLQKTERLLLENQDNENTKNLTKQLCQALDSFENALK